MKDVCIGRFMIMYFLVIILKGYEIEDADLLYAEMAKYFEIDKVDEYLEIINSEEMRELERPEDFQMYLRYLDYKDIELYAVMDENEDVVFIAKKTAVYIIDELIGKTDMNNTLDSLSKRMESFIELFNKSNSIKKDDFNIEKLFQELAETIYKHMDRHIFDKYSACCIVDKSKDATKSTNKQDIKIGF